MISSRHIGQREPEAERCVDAQDAQAHLWPHGTQACVRDASAKQKTHSSLSGSGAASL